MSTREIWQPCMKTAVYAKYLSLGEINWKRFPPQRIVILAATHCQAQKCQKNRKEIEREREQWQKKQWVMRFKWWRWEQKKKCTSITCDGEKEKGNTNVGKSGTAAVSKISFVEGKLPREITTTQEDGAFRHHRYEMFINTVRISLPFITAVPHAARITIRSDASFHVRPCRWVIAGWGARHGGRDVAARPLGARMRFWFRIPPVNPSRFSQQMHLSGRWRHTKWSV